jgi:hypothetical protein
MASTSSPADEVATTVGDDTELADWGDMPEEWQEEGDDAKRQPLQCSECGVVVMVASMFLLSEPRSWSGA